MLDSSGKKYVSLNVRGGGCSGFQYEWNFTDTTENGNLVDDILVVDVMAEMFLFGCTVDYIQELGGSYLKVVNPNATASCGCGESFAV
jgi:iron-sulfur cluster insertion protein